MNSLLTLPQPLFTAFGFLMGLMTGSFANVCIARIPRDMSVVLPSSHCPKCNTAIRIIDNIPILSYLFLKGKCRACGVHIPSKYFYVELVTGLLMAAVFYKFGFTWECLIYSIVVPTLVVITMIDAEHKIIPNIITFPGMVFGFVAGTYLNGFIDSLLGFLVGGGSFIFLAVTYFKVRKVEGMGMGDIKYIAAAGALLGWVQVLLVIFIGALSGSIFGTLGLAVKRLNFLSQIPFGPFLALATLISIFFGPELVDLYQSYLIPKN